MNALSYSCTHCHIHVRTVRLGLIEHRIGLIELGLGQRSNNARRTVLAWPVLILISLFFRRVYATLHLALLLDPFVGIFEVIRAFGHDHDGQRLQKHKKD